MSDTPPLGARVAGAATEFAVFSAHASEVELCLFDADAGEVVARRPLRRTGDIWHGRVDGVDAGQVYGYSVRGPDRPDLGHRFDPTSVLLDPYARAVCGGDSPRAVVVDRAPALKSASPQIAVTEMVVYECHVKGMTARHPEVAEELRGTFSGLASEPIVDHLRRLGVTTIELMPVQQSVTERRLRTHGMTNYWGYSTIGFFAPDARFATADRGEQVAEFRAMVDRLHAAGFEVILDVVYNHTAEGGNDGATLCFRGLDNAVYYRLDQSTPRGYIDTTGCGNTLATEHPQVRALVLDSLRYWVAEMGVDGFRFDLAPALLRHGDGFDDCFLSALAADPVLRNVKHIAEPWDLGAGGYRLGTFPTPWLEWNDRFRDDVRRYWRGDRGQASSFVRRVAGSPDVFGERAPWASVNFAACHDGFTLADLVRYPTKNNHDNCEGNRDGAGENHSSDAGDAAPQLQRALLATVALSRGVPMLGHGDEIGRSQRGNNNAYCHDGPLTWLDWNLDPAARDLLDFTARLFEIRRAHPALRAGESVIVRNVAGEELGEIGDGADDALALHLPGPPSLLWLCNPGPNDRTFVLPAGQWRVLLATVPATARAVGVVAAQSLTLLADGGAA